MTATLCFVLGVSAPISAQTREIDPNGLYPERTVLSSPMTGVTFRLPEGTRAEWDSGVGGLAALSSEGAFGGIWGWSEGTVGEIVAEMGVRLRSQGIELEVRGEPVLTVDSMRAEFDAMAEGVEGVLHAAVLVGPEGGAIAIAGLAQPSASTSARALVDAIVFSVSWSRPAVAAWREELVGRVLAPAEPSDDATLAFCEDGSWWLVADLAGTTTLIVEAEGGETSQWTVERSVNGFTLDGRDFVFAGRC